MRDGVGPCAGRLGGLQDDALDAGLGGPPQHGGSVDVRARAGDQEGERLGSRQRGGQAGRVGEIRGDRGDTRERGRRGRDPAGDGGHGMAGTREGLDERAADVAGSTCDDDQEWLLGEMLPMRDASGRGRAAATRGI